MDKPDEQIQAKGAAAPAADTGKKNEGQKEDPDINRARLIKTISLVILALLFGAACFFVVRYIPASGGGSGSSTVRLNEIMSSSAACPNADGLFYDYIELYNDSDTQTDISGYMLLNNNAPSASYVFGNNTVLPAHGYVVVSCDGKKTEHGDKALYAAFPISRSGGDKIALLDSLGVIVDSVTTDNLSKNEAMIRTMGGKWDTTSTGTPGFENSDEGRAAYLDSIRSSGGLTITELMAKNLSGIVAKNGQRYDWIEIGNTTGAAIDLGGYHISDDPSRLCGYVLPSMEIAPGGCVVIFASKLAKYEDSEIHTDFSLSANGKTLYLLSPSGKLDSVVTYPSLPDNYSYMLKEGEYVVSAYSSPGSLDTQPSGNAYEGLGISELMPTNTGGLTDGDGDFSDWIELTNASTKDIDLSGCWLSIDPSDPFGWQFPVSSIKSGSCIVVFASGKSPAKEGELHANFKLPPGPATLTLTSPTGSVIDSVSYASSQPDRSLIKTTDGLESTVYSSPGYPNGTDGYTAYQESLAPGSPLIISEAMTDNSIVLPQAYGRYFDWIEIKNTSESPVKLSDYYLSDKFGESKMWRMPDETLAPGAYRVFICSGDEKLNDGKYTHTNFSLNSETETLFIFGNDGKMCDHVLLCDIPTNVSAGRMDGQNGMFYFSNPTPGEPNTGGVRTVSSAPYSTTLAGEYNQESLTVPLFSEGNIYYTTDGSWPDQSSTKYTTPITITKSTVIRAVTCETGSLKSSTTTLSFFLNEGNTLPIMSLSANPSDLWSSKTGIYQARNAFKPWKKDAHLEFFDNGGKGFSIDCGLSLFGGGSRVVSAKKSFQVRFSGVYGETSLHYDMFEGSDVNEFKSLVFRGGQDAKHAIIRNEIFTTIAIKESPTLLAQRSRYCLLYINGEFFGIYCIMERLGDDYYASHFNVPMDSVEVVKGPVRENTDIYQLMSFVSHNDMRKQENYEYVQSKLDINSLMDWYIFEACSGNNDLSGNVRYIRSTQGDGKWRLALFDMDFALRWPVNNFGWLYNTHNQHAKFLVGLIKNPEFKDKFLTRFGYLLNNVFTEDKLQALIDKLTGQLRGDVVRERQKWHSAYKTYDEGLQRLYNVLHKYNYKGRIVNSVCKTLRLTAAERQKYFGF